MISRYHSMQKRCVFLIVTLLIAILLGACGFLTELFPDADPDNNDNQLTDTDPDHSGDSEDDATQVIPLNGYDLALTTGTYWTFYWYYERSSGWMASYDSNSSSSEDMGYVTVTLGVPATLSDRQLFTVALTGDIPEKWNDNFWTHLGVAADGSLIGSDNGTTVETILNAAQARTDTSFFRFFTASQEISAATFSADVPTEYTTSAEYSAYSTTSDESVSVPGYGYIAGDEMNYYLREYYKPGWGPLGFYEYQYWKDINSSGDYDWGRHSWTINLSETSLAADDGFEIPASAWKIYSEMPSGVRREPEVVELDGLLYILGGQDEEFNANTSLYREGNDGEWVSAGTVLPSSWTSSSATIRNTGSAELIVFTVNDSDPKIYSYNPDFGLWVHLNTLSGAGSFYDSFAWGSDLLYLILDNYIQPYRFSTAAFLDYNDYIDIHDDMTYMSSIVTGDNIYIVGQYLVSGGGFFNSEYIYSTRLFYYDNGWSDLTWSVDTKRRWNPALVIYNDRLYVIGGTEDETDVVSCSIAGTAPADWQIHTPMLYGGRNLDAVVKDDTILVFGCDDGRKIEVYTPANDN